MAQAKDEEVGLLRINECRGVVDRGTLQVVKQSQDRCVEGARTA